MSSSIGPPAPDDDRWKAVARLFDAVHEGIYLGLIATTGPDRDTTLAANRCLKALFGYPVSTPESEVLALAPERFEDPAARTSLLQQLFAAGSIADYPVRMLRTDGTVIPVAITARAEPGRAPWVSVEALVRAAGESPRRESATSSPYNERVHPEHLAALGEAVSGVAHDLNNPLATIISWSERLADRSDGLSRRGIGIIAAEAQRAARMVRNLLAFAQKRQTTRTRVDVNRIVRETLALRAHEHGLMKIDATEVLAPDLPEALADGYQIQQVLLNLITNAEQAMVAAHGGGALLLRTHADMARAMVVLEVSDDGPGVSPQVRDRIFDPFFTTKETGHGTGLGLTVADAIVRAHGGEIRIESRLPRGTAFFVDLPVSIAATPSAHPAPMVPDALRGAAVLFVEDEDRLAAAVVEALTEAGLTVDHAGDGEDALARVRRRAYDIVICDLQMPHMNGMMLYRAIAATTPALARRVIFVTGEVAGTGTERFLADSGCRWVAKPFRFEDLLRAVLDTLA